MSNLDLRFPVFQRDWPFELMFYIVLGPPAHLDLRFPVFLRGGRFEIIKYNVSDPWAVSTDACAAKSPARDLGTFFPEVIRLRVPNGRVHEQEGRLPGWPAPKSSRTTPEEEE